MNSLYKTLRFFVALFSVLYSTSFSSDWSNCAQIKLSVFTHEYKKDSGNNSVHGDFSYDHTWNNFNDHGSSRNAKNFDSYTIEDFQHRFGGCGYTESELLNQRCLYIYDAFVQYAQTYPSYKGTIQRLYAELKNLNLFQKAWRVAKGTYCRKLQKRIAYLYKQLNAVKAISQDSGSHNTLPVASTKVATFDVATFANQCAEYKELTAVYDIYTPSLAKAINTRSAIYYNIADRDFVLERINKPYNLNKNVKELLSHYGHELVLFTHCSGNQLQQVIHQESLKILESIDSLMHHSVLYDHQEALVDLTAAMVDYNHVGMTDKAMTIGDLCWTLLDYGQAIAEGAALGMYSAMHDILTNPIEATVSIVAGKQILAFQLCKVLYNVADVGLTAMHNMDGAKEKWNKYAGPLNNIIDAINKKEITVRDAIKGSTAFVVGYKAQSKLLGGLSKFCTTIKHKSISFVKNNSLLNPQEYLTTPEGLLFKATHKSNKIKLDGKGSAASGLKKTVENKISQKNTLPTVTVGDQGIIRQGNLRAKIEEYRRHIFSEKHEQAGLMAVGENQEAIMDSLCETLLFLDKKGCLREGNNQLRIMLNGIDNIEVRCFIQKGEVIGINAFLSTFGRIFNNFIDARNLQG